MSPVHKVFAFIIFETLKEFFNEPNRENPYTLTDEEKAEALTVAGFVSLTETAAANRPPVNIPDPNIGKPLERPTDYNPQDPSDFRYSPIPKPEG